MMSLSDDKPADINNAFNTTSRYSDDISNINNVIMTLLQVQYTLQSSNLLKLTPLIPTPRFLTCIGRFLMILFLPKFMISVMTLILKLSIFPFLDGDVPRSTSYGVYISQLIRFARASSHVAGFDTRNTLLTQKLLKLLIGIINFAKPFLNFIDDTMNRYLNSKLDLNLSCAKDFGT